MFQRFTLLIITGILLLNTGFSQVENNIISGEILVQLNTGSNVSAIENQFSSIGLKSEKLLSARMNAWLFTYDPSKIADDNILFTVRQHPDVSIVQFNHVLQLRDYENYKSRNQQINEMLSPEETFPNDPRFDEQWALNNTGQSGGTPDADIDAPEAWDFSTGGITALGDTIVVAIVDGGADLNHNDLNYWFNYDEIPNNNIDDDNNGYIDDYRGWNAYGSNGDVPSSSHGTHVSGIAAAHGNNGLGVSGVNWLCKVMPVAGSSSNEATVVEAYGYVLEQRAKYNETNGLDGAFIVATNASFGVDFGQPENYPLWCAMYDSLGVQGILNCGATANINIDIDVEGDVPTACPSEYMIAVTNTTDTDQKNGGAAYGLTTIDLGAPGTSILSTDLSNSYSYKTGTSMATPTVTGAIALMFAGANSGIMQAYKNNPSQGALNFRNFLFDAVDVIPALDGITVTGGRLNIFNALLAIGTSPDSIPPAQVNDLVVVDTTSNSLTVNWTVPLDTTRNGVVGYDIRMSASPISDSVDFYNATQIPFGQEPDTTGATETLLIDGLDFNSTYYFALRAFDLWGNLSEISNNAEGTTWDEPVIDVDPTELNVVLQPNMTHTEIVQLSNISSNNSTLDFEITLDNNTFPENMITYRLLPAFENLANVISKEKDFTGHGGAINGAGGPDGFGYEWIDSEEPNGPEYIWEDISSTGTEATDWTPTGTWDPKDEGFAGPFNLGFEFDFYGIPHNEVYIGSNGLFTFEPLTENTFTHDPIPDNGYPDEFIAPFWDDLDGSDQGNVYYLQDGNRFIMQFDGWGRFSGSGDYTFQLILYSSGKILVYYENMSGETDGATIGIENPDGTDGLNVAYNSVYVQNGLALKFSAEPDWLENDISSGTIYNNNSIDIELIFQTEDFPLGDYSMDMIINSNDPVSPELVIPVSMLNTNIPVELTNFSAKSNKNSVLLKWQTATETNNNGFQIERKKEYETNWSQVKFIKGYGSSTETVNYNYVDENLKVGKYIYRLKQIDFDGSFEYSNEVEVSVETPDEYSLFQNYPNPFNPITTIEYSLPEKADVKILIYSVIGELVRTLENATKDAGYYKLNFDASNLPSGTYIYRIHAKNNNINFIDSKKMILIK